MKKYNLIGQKFNYLTVVSSIQGYDKCGKKNGKRWICICDCGNERLVRTPYLIHNILVSCGCKNFTNITHGNRKYEEDESAFRAKISTYKASAKNRKIEWNLSYDEAIKIIKSNCHYCGRIPNNSYDLYNGRKRFLAKEKFYEIKYNGIDRINSKLGYIIDNVVPCCTICNFGKNDLTYEEFTNWINDLIKFRTNS